MSYGWGMGLFWAFKYIFFILGVSYPFFSLIYWGLTFLVPFFLALFLIHFHLVLPKRISFARDWTLGVLIFFFAALIVSLEHYAFFRYFAPPDYIADSIKSAMDMVESSTLSEEVKKAVASKLTPTPILMTLQGIFNNLMYGALVSFPVALFTSCFKVNDKYFE
jgi:hypothetical protein